MYVNIGGPFLWLKVGGCSIEHAHVLELVLYVQANGLGYIGYPAMQKGGPIARSGGLYVQDISRKHWWWCGRTSNAIKSGLVCTLESALGLCYSYYALNANSPQMPHIISRFKRCPCPCQLQDSSLHFCSTLPHQSPRTPLSFKLENNSGSRNLATLTSSLNPLRLLVFRTKSLAVA